MAPFGENIMKSNEEFIAGIYEKAAVYKEEKKVKYLFHNTHAVLRMAAMLAVCVGMTAIGVLVAPGKNSNQTEVEENGVGTVNISSYMNDITTEPGVTQQRIGKQAYQESFTGVLVAVDGQEGIVWICPESEGKKGSEGWIAIRWELTEEFPEGLADGTRLMAAGLVDTYNKTGSEKSGSREIKLTEKDNFLIWSEEAKAFINYFKKAHE